MTWCPCRRNSSISMLVSLRAPVLSECRGRMGGMSSEAGWSAPILDRILAEMAGPGAGPRADQQCAVAALAEQRRRVLLVQATGWGKSAVYWAATVALRQAGAGPTLVISPLLALMRDQVDAA